MLNPLYLKDKVQNAYIQYETFEAYKRPKELNMKDYINEFERLHNKIKEYDMALPDGVLAYKLLKQAGLSETHEQLIRATITDLSYENMKLQLKKTFGDICTPAGQTDNIKVEPVMHLSHSKNTKDTYNIPYSNTNRSGYRGRYNFRGSQGATPRNLSGRNFYSQGLSSRHQSPRFGRGQPGSCQVNPPDQLGNPSRCNVCGSIFHWAANCPDSGGSHERQDFSQKRKDDQIFVASLRLKNEIGERQDFLRRLG